MQSESELDKEARERALARIRATGKPIRDVAELLGPEAQSHDPQSHDPEDVDAFLAFLQEMRQPIRLPDDTEDDQSAPHRP